jgi:hypothetical protein
MSDTDHTAIPLFPESDSEREVREAFYNTTPARSDEHFDVYTHSISVKGSLALKEKLNNCEEVTVAVADADGNVIASGVGDISVGFAPHFTKEANIMERAHKAKLR